jgi:membrane-associated protein
MTYRQFVVYNVVGGFVWIYSFMYLGYAFGNLPVVQKNFKLIIVGIIVLSVLPIVIEFVQAWRHRRREAAAPRADG